MTDEADEALGAAIRGKRILVVEDEPVVAMLIEDVIADLGAVVVGPVARVPRALGLLEAEAVDAALLDVNLAGEVSTPVAEALGRRGIPFAFATGYGAAGVPSPFEGSPFLAKPFMEADLRDVLARLLGPQGTT